MTFETKQDVLNWYEGQERALTDVFIGAIPWREVKNYELDPRLIPVLEYMRDVETMTDMYWREMSRTPTGRDPVIRKFMERWGVEEVTHGEVINRFLNEAGVPTDDNWQSQVRGSVSKSYQLKTYLLTLITNLIGSKFTATHMTFGAVHEMTTAQSYRRLIEIADHPVLTHILKAVIREESAHTQFYWSMARLELQRNESAQKLARFVIENFYYPVGQGSKPKKQTHYTVSTLFAEGDGIAVLDKTITDRVQKLPGFEGVTKVTETIGKICRDSLLRMNSATASLLLMASVTLFDKTQSLL
jgi:hypothetical protein